MLYPTIFHFFTNITFTYFIFHFYTSSIRCGFGFIFLFFFYLIIMKGYYFESRKDMGEYVYAVTPVSLTQYTPNMEMIRSVHLECPDMDSEACTFFQWNKMSYNLGVFIQDCLIVSFSLFFSFLLFLCILFYLILFMSHNYILSQRFSFIYSCFFSFYDIMTMSALVSSIF